MRPFLTLPLLAALSAPFAAPAQEPAGDTAAPPAGDPVAARLAERGIGYEIDEDGDYRIVYSWEREGRTQLVFVSGRAEELAGHRIREVFSPAARLEDGLDPDAAGALLRDSQSRKLGAWELAGDVLYYVVKLPEPFSAELLEIALAAAAETADDKELELSGDLDAL